VTNTVERLYAGAMSGSATIKGNDAASLRITLKFLTFARQYMLENDSATDMYW